MVSLVIGKKKQQNTQGGIAGGQVPMPSANEDLISLNRRVKVLEERYTNIRGKIQLLEQNMLNKHKNFFSETKSLNLEITDVKKEINEVKDKIISLIKEFDSFAKKEQVDILRKYIDLWNPVKFVTKHEVEEVVREVIEKMRKEK